MLGLKQIYFRNAVIVWRVIPSVHPGTPDDDEAYLICLKLDIALNDLKLNDGQYFTDDEKTFHDNISLEKLPMTSVIVIFIGTNFYIVFLIL